MGFCYLPSERAKMGLLLFTPWQSETSSEQQETNSKVKMGKGSRWASVIYPLKKSKCGLLLFTPWQSQTNSEQQERNKQQGQNEQRVKMGQVSRLASVLYPLTESNQQRTARKTNSRVKMGEESKWAKGHNGLLLFTPLKESKWGKDHYGLLLFTPWQSETSSEQQERNKQQGQNGQRVKMVFCYLPPERVKMGLLLFTPWQSPTNSEQQERNKQQGQMGKESKWAKGQDGLLFFTPWQSQTSSEQQGKQTAGSKWAKGQDGLLLFTPWKSQNVLLLFTPWQSQTNWTARKKQRVGSNWAKRSQVGPGPFWLGDNRVKLGQKESSWAWVKLGQAHFESESNRAKESRWVGTHPQWTRNSSLKQVSA